MKIIEVLKALEDLVVSEKMVEEFGITNFKTNESSGSCLLDPSEAAEELKKLAKDSHNSIKAWRNGKVVCVEIRTNKWPFVQGLAWYI